MSKVEVCFLATLFFMTCTAEDVLGFEVAATFNYSCTIVSLFFVTLTLLPWRELVADTCCDCGFD